MIWIHIKFFSDIPILKTKTPTEKFFENHVESMCNKRNAQVYYMISFSSKNSRLTSQPELQLGSFWSEADAY